MFTHRNAPFRSKAALFIALASLVESGYKPGSHAYDLTAKAGYRNGKHNGKQAGAFGGSKAAKNHRKLYVTT